MRGHRCNCGAAAGRRAQPLDTRASGRAASFAMVAGSRECGALSRPGGLSACDKVSVQRKAAQKTGRSGMAYAAGGRNLKAEAGTHKRSELQPGIRSGLPGRLCLGTLVAAVFAVLGSPFTVSGAESRTDSPSSPSSAPADAGGVSGEFRVETDNMPSPAELKVLSVTRFAVRVAAETTTAGSVMYLQNHRFLDSAVFPQRLFEKLEKQKWQPSPFRPVPLRDMACYYSVPSYRRPQEVDVHTAPIAVEADAVNGNLQDRADDLTYSGDVVITQGDRVINTDTAHYDGAGGKITTSGHSVVHLPEYTITTDEEMLSEISSGVSVLKDADIQVNGSVMRGSAAVQVIDREKKTQHLEDVSVTACPPGSSFWHLSATSVDLDQNEDFGSAWNSVLWLGKVPVFYFPYLNFPITSERKSGLLYPSIGFGSDGFGLMQPIYFNLAPNYDWTFTPGWDAEHGWEFDNELRMMPFENVYGVMQFNYLPKDRNWDTAPSESDRKRWFFSFKGRAAFFDNDLNVYLNYTRVRKSDYEYLSDISQKNIAITDSHLKRSLRAVYARPKYDISAEIRDYQSLVSPLSGRRPPFGLMPQVKFNYTDSWYRLGYTLDAEFSRFSREAERNYQSMHTDRVHLEPAFSYHILDYRGTTLDAGARFFLTHYSQGNFDVRSSRDLSDLRALGVYDSESLERSRTRALYELEIRGRTTFERKVIDMRHTQTLEPEIKYQFIPYRNQKGIALYDSTDRAEDFYSLFSWRRYSGLDRIADVNAVSLGVTSRLLDAHDREILKIAVAQTYNFEPTRVSLTYDDNHDDYPRSLLAFSLDASPWQGVTFHHDSSYNTQDSKIEHSTTTLRYEQGGVTAGISYRFIRDDSWDLKQYLADQDAWRAGNGTRPRWQSTDLKQLGLELSVPLGRNWRLTGVLYRDLGQKINMDRKIAIRYEDCCWSVGFVYEDYLRLLSRNGNVVRKDKRIFGIEFELKGLMQVGSKSATPSVSTGTKYYPVFNPVSLNR